MTVQTEIPRMPRADRRIAYLAWVNSDCLATQNASRGNARQHRLHQKGADFAIADLVARGERDLAGLLTARAQLRRRLVGLGRDERPELRDRLRQNEAAIWVAIGT